MYSRSDASRTDEVRSHFAQSFRTLQGFVGRLDRDLVFGGNALPHRPGNAATKHDRGGAVEGKALPHRVVRDDVQARSPGDHGLACELVLHSAAESRVLLRATV